MNKKGFTLIELLAAISLLALLTIIVVTGVLSGLTRNQGKITDAQMKIFEHATYLFMESSDEYPITAGMTYNITLQQLIDAELLKTPLKDKDGNELDYETMAVTVTIYGTNEIIYEFTGLDGSQMVNRPRLSRGMTPIKWDGTVEIETTAGDSEWYDYANKKWANAKTEDGSYWVWIPRFASQVASNYHTLTQGVINIKFLKGGSNYTYDGELLDDSAPILNGTSQTNFFKMPAFSFGDTEIDGFWMAKFSSTPTEGTDCYTTKSAFNCNVSTIYPKSVPNVIAWTFIGMNNAFLVGRNMEKSGNPYGWRDYEVETHLIKRSEWAAAAYLSNSNYGLGTELMWINPNNSRITGCAGDSSTSAATATCRAYDSANGQKTSTTGNITGVFDMKGNVFQWMAGHVPNTNAASLAPNLSGAELKYKDIYPIGASDSYVNNYAVSPFGMGFSEVSSATEGGTWNNGYAYYPYATAPFVFAAGAHSYGARAGEFLFYRYAGEVNAETSFRTAVVVGVGL